MNSRKLSVQEQIDHMKSKGIKFNIFDEEKALHFLEFNTYFFKLKSYAKNYEKYLRGENCGKYVNLEFAYLIELSTLDLHLRKFIIKLCLDIEHHLKLKLVRDCCNNKHEDGYTIVKDFLNENPKIKSDFEFKATSYNTITHDLLRKFKDNLAIWNIVEVLTFGDFKKLYTKYYTKYPSDDSLIHFIWSVNFLRNAAAHNNCLLNSLKSPYSRVARNKSITSIISTNPTIGYDERIKKMSNPIISDFIITLYVFREAIKSEAIKEKTITELRDFFDNRMLRNKEYFKNNPWIKSNYSFVKKNIDYLFPQSI